MMTSSPNSPSSPNSASLLIQYLLPLEPGRCEGAAHSVVAMRRESGGPARVIRRAARAYRREPACSAGSPHDP
ncbi:MAG: transglutaminase domain-containing protein [Ktedonobacterales bacterium]